MTFDEHLKEVARAHDAVDRLRDAQSQLASDAEQRENQRDRWIRAIALLMIFVVVMYAYYRM